MDLPLGIPVDSGQPPITEQTIYAMVHQFYGRIRVEPTLGPIFDAQIPPDAWPKHLARMCDFWSLTLLGSSRYQGNPLRVHAQLEVLELSHFALWLDLFADTLRQVYPEATAARIEDKARRIGRKLEQAAR
jgi:hemoglobin